MEDRRSNFSTFFDEFIIDNESLNIFRSWLIVHQRLKRVELFLDHNVISKGRSGSRKGSKEDLALQISAINARILRMDVNNVHEMEVLAMVDSGASREKIEEKILKALFASELLQDTYWNAL